jgi:hypothetical protein
VTSEIEQGLNDDFRVIPGMGEFGDRYFGTDDYQSSTPFFGDAKDRVRSDDISSPWTPDYAIHGFKLYHLTGLC